jgi:hypothetical protein
MMSKPKKSEEEEELKMSADLQSTSPKFIYGLLRTKILTALKISMLVFLLATQCGLVGRYQHFGRRYFSPQDEGSMFFRNVGIYLQTHMALLHRRKKHNNL